MNQNNQNQNEFEQNIEKALDYLRDCHQPMSVDGITEALRKHATDEDCYEDVHVYMHKKYGWE